MPEEYRGPRFESRHTTASPSYSAKPAIRKTELEQRRLLVECCREFYKFGLSPEYTHAGGKGTAGNFSIRTKSGFLITGTPKHAATIDTEGLVNVHGGELDKNKVISTGLKLPSSESLMHLAIYSAKPGVGAIVHWHDDKLLEKIPKGVVETDGKAPAGTVEFAKLAAKAAQSIKGTTGVIALKGHGFVAFGKDIDEAKRAALKFY
jgi:L-fuculose-phosphate aldolase